MRGRAACATRIHRVSAYETELWPGGLAVAAAPSMTFRHPDVAPVKSSDAILGIVPGARIAWSTAYSAKFKRGSLRWRGYCADGLQES
jgi:hypothetical protein